VRETGLTLGNIDLIKLSQSSVADSGYLIKRRLFFLRKRRYAAWRAIAPARGAAERRSRVFPREVVESLHQQ
jgi:hypothetical protein